MAQDVKDIWRDKDHIALVFECLQDVLSDLGRISAYNDDIFWEEVTDIEDRLSAMREKMGIDYE